MKNMKLNKEKEISLKNDLSINTSNLYLDIIATNFSIRVNKGYPQLMNRYFNKLNFSERELKYATSKIIEDNETLYGAMPTIAIFIKYKKELKERDSFEKFKKELEEERKKKEEERKKEEAKPKVSSEEWNKFYERIKNISNKHKNNFEKRSNKEEEEFKKIQLLLKSIKKV